MKTTKRQRQQTKLKMLKQQEMKSLTHKLRLGRRKKKKKVGNILKSTCVAGHACTNDK